MKWVIFILCCVPFFVAAESDKEYIHFKKIKHKRSVAIQLPMSCRMFEKGQEKRTVKIVKVKDSLLVYSYFNYDTVKVNALLKSKLPRKEKDKKIDSLIDASKVFKAVPFSHIQKIELLSSDANVGRKALMLGGSLLILGSGFGLLASTSNHVGQGFNKLDWLLMGGIGVGFTSMTVLIKRTFDMNKWMISSSP